MWRQATIGSARPVSHGEQFYCTLIGHPFRRQYKKHAYLFVTRDPVDSTIAHNSGAVDSKHTRGIAPFWHILVAVGPFVTVEAAMAFGRLWLAGTRGCPSKTRRGPLLAKRYHVGCYSAAVKPPGGSTRVYLKRRAPARYIKTFRRMTRVTTTAAV
jgi:hypothetical protein